MVLINPAPVLHEINPHFLLNDFSLFFLWSPFSEMLLLFSFILVFAWIVIFSILILTNWPKLLTAFKTLPGLTAWIWTFKRELSWTTIVEFPIFSNFLISSTLSNLFGLSKSKINSVQYPNSPE